LYIAYVETKANLDTLLPKPAHQVTEPQTKAGWWYTYPSEKYDFVSWDDEIPNIWKNN
jgi:hypothetical protein